MSAPKVSVGLPVYNGAKYLAEAIESVRAQTFGDFELVISDNCSTDATEEMCRDFAGRDSRIRYVRAEQNRGAARNFNRTFELSKGEYFKWLAHDDVIGPRYLASAVEVLDRDESVVLCHSKTGIIDASGQLMQDTGAADLESFELQGITRDSESKRLVKAQSIRAHQRYLGVLLYSIRNHEVFGLIRSAKMRKTGLHHPYCGGEKVFLADLATHGKFHEVPEVQAFSRWHPERFSAGASARAQLIHMDPNSARWLWLPRQVRSTCGYFHSIVQSELSWHERVCCLAVLGRFAMQAGKWKRILQDYAGGAGQVAALPEPTAEQAQQMMANKHWTSLSSV